MHRAPRHLLPALALLLAISAAPARAQQDHLTVERIFGSYELTPQGLPETHWMPGGHRFTFLVANPQKGTDLVAYDVQAGTAQRLVDGSKLIPGGERQPIDIEGYQWFPDGRRLLVFTRSVRVWRENTKGVYFVYSFADGSLQPVSTAFGYQMFAKPSPDGTRVAFVRDHDLWVTELATGKETRLTFDGSDDIINGTFDWVYEEELGLRDGWRWSPDGRKISFWQLDQSPIPDFKIVDDLKLYPQVTDIPYPKAGEPNSIARIGVLDVASGAITWMDTGSNPDVYLARMEWAESSDELVIQRMNRHQNRIDVLMADAASGKSRALFSETSDTWVDVDLDMTWVNGGSQFLWTSERDGYEHLYLYDRDGSVARQLTSGEWPVDAPQGVSADGWVYFTAAKEGPLERHLYRVKLEGGDVERITTDPGTHDVDMAPDARYFVDSRSRNGDPAVVSVRDGTGTVLRTLVDNHEVRDELTGMGLRRPEFFTFQTPDGVTLNGWMIKPPDFDPHRQYPVVMYVYGGPGSQSAADEWGGNRYLFHQLLAQEGFIVASVDNRGTGERGRAFKNITYLHLGEYESRDQVSAARYLGSLPYVDASRIGIWGWSYGGYMTILTLERGGDVFAAGVSVAPVTDWRFYDTIYTERYMRTPRENPDGYRQSAPASPENIAGLTARLLLVHGTGDDNVHFQNSVQMVHNLQEAGKQFQLMIYPDKTHSITGETAQVHLYNTMNDFLRERLGG